MDQQRFDNWVRSLATGTSRRALLQCIAGGALGGALGLLRGGSARADDECSAFCRELPPGPKRGQCRAECAHGSGLFVACGGDPNRLCERPDGTFVCCDPNQPCVGGACQPPPPPPPDGCTTNADCDDDDPCTEDVCTIATGECSNEAIPGCGDDVCVCVLKGEGDVCAADEECCTGYCGEDFGEGQTTCQYGESGCAGEGAFCSGTSGTACCTGVCQDCACTCLAPGTPCETDDSCCGICAATGCCREVDSRCTGNADCCSGVCTFAYNDDDGVPVFTCDRGPGGTPCRGGGTCQSLTCCNGVCCPDCPSGAFCDANTNPLGVCACYP